MRRVPSLLVWVRMYCLLQLPVDTSKVQSLPGSWKELCIALVWLARTWGWIYENESNRGNAEFWTRRLSTYQYQHTLPTEHDTKQYPGHSIDFAMNPPGYKHSDICVVRRDEYKCKCTHHVHTNEQVIFYLYSHQHVTPHTSSSLNHFQSPPYISHCIGCRLTLFKCNPAVKNEKQNANLPYEKGMGNNKNINNCS